MLTLQCYHSKRELTAVRREMTAVKDAKSSDTSKTSTCTPILDLTTQSSLFQIAKNLTAWKKIFNRIAVLNSKISKKRMVFTDLNQLIEKKPTLLF